MGAPTLDLILVMEQIFILKIEDEAPLEDLFKKYISSGAFTFIQHEVAGVDWRSFRDESDKTRMMTWRTNRQLKNIVDRCRQQFPMDSTP